MLWQAQANSVDEYGVLFALLTFVVIAAVIIAIRERSRAKALEGRVEQMQGAFSAHAQASQGNEQTERARQNLMFDQHKRLNELTIAKFEAEIELIKNQVVERDREQERYIAGKEYHELMVEKSRLEIDSLRLHITELRQRLDDWKFGG